MALPPVIPGSAAARLVGIARLAAESPKNHERAEVEYFDLPSRSALNREASGHMPFDWTLNPYRGCEFGCPYCYARYTHEFMELREGEDFERKIYAKLGMPGLLRAELTRARERSMAIALGTATDPYQPAEKRYRVTRRLLEVFSRFAGLELSITTKSVLILRDLDLLRQTAARHRFSIHMTVTTVDEELARRLEPKAPPPAKRLEAVRRLSDAGLFVAINAMPVFPGITDSRRMLEPLARAATAAGARALYGTPLFLKPASKSVFMPFLERQFPHLTQRYRRLYAHSAYLGGDYARDLGTLLAELRARYGLDHRVPDAPARANPQLELPLALENGS